MSNRQSLLLSAASAMALAFSLTPQSQALADARYDAIPPMPLGSALDAFAQRSGLQIVYVSSITEGKRTKGAPAGLSAEETLKSLLSGTGLHYRFIGARTVTISDNVTRRPSAAPVVHATASVPAAVETVVVTAQKKTENIQNVPIAVTALSQAQLTERQIAGGPDLVKEVPNLTFSKTNFSGYNLEIRGIGTQAISVTTDPAVAVAFNSIPFIRNHFFEQEFYDLQDAEVLRGPQGTLYGRNATAGVVNIKSALPTDQFEAMASADIGNYSNRRLEGMLNIPIVGDKLDIRLAGEWTKRDGYTDDTTLNMSVDGRDLWSTRLSIGWKPTSDIQTYFIWEHFSEDDDRLRSGKQLCKTDPGPTSVDGVPVPPAMGSAFNLTSASFSQGCADTSMYSPQAFEVPNGFSLPFVSGAAYLGFINTNIDPYAETTQSTNLRDIQSAILPHYIAKNDTLEYNADWNMGNGLTFTSQTGYNNDFLWSTEDFNRFDTSPGIFIPNAPNGGGIVPANGVFCDPQLGCSNRLIVQDLSTEKAWQFSQEFRLASNFSGPLNFSAGANYLHYETVEDYYVFSNTFTMISLNNICNYRNNGRTNVSITNSLECLSQGESYIPPSTNSSVPTESPQYIDPNPLSGVNGEGHNYFLSENPYVLNSYAVFGETYYEITNELKLTGGLRFTDDEKQFIDIPSELLTEGYGYPSVGSVQQQWDQFTGRFVANWSPDLSFTDQSMFYASYAHGYKAGGANPPGPVLINADTLIADSNITFPDHPLTFKPEFIEAFELGTKNSALDNSLTLNADIFYYNYTGYQISEIVDRTAINLNFNANVEGAELESNWEPLPGLRLSFAGGFETSSLAGGSEAIDLMDRTAGMPGWMIMKPSVGQSSNCVFPDYVVAAMLKEGGGGLGNPLNTACGEAYFGGLDPVTGLPYVANPTQINNTYSGAYGFSIPAGYPGFNPATAPNNGEGFDKILTGNQLPNAPHFTTSLTAEYTMSVTNDWAATFHTDLYWQSQQWARVFEDPIDKIHGYSNVNLSLILTNDAGWQVMGYVKNVFNVTAITGTFLNSDDTGLTTNVFLTDPRLYGVRVTKQFDGGDWPTGGLNFIPDLFADTDGGKPVLWIELGGDFDQLNAGQQPFMPTFQPLMPAGLPTPTSTERTPNSGLDYTAKVDFEPTDTDWVFSASVRYGRSARNLHAHQSIGPAPKTSLILGTSTAIPCNQAFSTPGGVALCENGYHKMFADDTSHESEQHTILDFTAGKDVGLGFLDSSGSGTFSGGVRVAAFTSKSVAQFNADPYYKFKTGLFNKYDDIYNVTSHEKRSFRGIGPEVKWDETDHLLRDFGSGAIGFDWGVNGGALFGRQTVALNHQQTKAWCFPVSFPAKCFGSSAHGGYQTAQNVRRVRTVVVPNLGAYAGISFVYNNAKVSFGYRVDEFFGAMDGGQTSYRSENRGFYGPYANISIGLGG